MIKSIINANLNKDFDKILIARINKKAEYDTPIAKISNAHYRIYLQATILNGFNYLEFTLINPEPIKTMGGCSLTFIADNKVYTLKSESDIIEGDYSINNKIGITLIDTDYENDFVAFVKENSINEIKFQCKVGSVFKKKLTTSYNEIDMEAFLHSMIPKEAEATGEVSNPGGSSNLGI